MANSSRLIQRGKKFSYLLQHDNSYVFDEHGWREVSDLVAKYGLLTEFVKAKYLHCV